MAPTNEQIRQASLDVEDVPEKPLFKDGDKALEFLRTEAEVGESESVDERRREFHTSIHDTARTNLLILRFSCPQDRFYDRAVDVHVLPVAISGQVTA